MFINVLRRRPDRVQVYAGVLVAAAAILAGALYAFGWRLGAPPLALGGLALVALLAERQSVRITSSTEMSVSVLPLVFAAVVFGPLDAMIVAICGLATDFRRPFLRWAVWSASRAMLAAFASIAAWEVASGRDSFGTVLLAVAVAALVEAAGDISLNAITGALRRTASFVETIEAIAALQLASIPLYTPLVAVLAYVYVVVSPWTAALFLVPALAAQRLFVLYEEQRRLAGDLVSANERLERANLSFVSTLVSALDARDQYTAGHSAAVAVYARDIARHLGLTDDEQQLAHRCALLHDIGKVGLPPGILEKEGALTLDERRTMQRHAEIGERILSNFEDYAEVARIVRHHHERVDGFGYPDGIRGEQIPLISRIIAVADAYNAMTSGRPYREAMESGIARLRLAQAVGSQFDISVVAAFEAVLAAASDSYARGADTDFAVDAQRHAVLTPHYAISA